MEITPIDTGRRPFARTSTTIHPAAPVVVMLGEIVVHGEDIRRSLGLAHIVGRAVAVADNNVESNLLVGSKRRFTDF